MPNSEALVKERIVNDLAEHKITLLHSHGMYRHWRCAKPGTRVLWFDIVTWPGSLCYTGDMGDYLFQRTTDMVAFMRGSAMSYSYAAEKCVAHDGRLKEWREEIFRERLAARIEECEDGKRKAAVTKEVESIISEFETYQSRHDAEKAMYESGLWDGGDMPSCEDYTFHFLWALHAIKWFCDNVDETKGPQS
jgi:hypothetical protein